MRVILEKEPEGPKKVGHRKTVISVTGSGKWRKVIAIQRDTKHSSE
jgi:hypothetical protein